MASNTVSTSPDMVTTDAISAALRAARTTNTALGAFPVGLPADLAGAYAVQDRSIGLWPDTVAGWKVGGIAPALHDTVGAQRLAGPIFAKTVKYATPGEPVAMPSYAGGFVAVEAEWIFELGDVSGFDTRSDDPEDVAKVVRAVYAGVEIASSPMIMINDLGPGAIISDFGNNFGLLVGPEVTGWSDHRLSSTPVTVAIDGVEVGNTTAKPGLEGGLGAVKFLIENLRWRGVENMAGLMVSSGAITGVHQTQIGASAEVSFDGIGQLDIDLVSIPS